MALYRQGKAAMDENGIVIGTGTNWQSALTLIRPGATILFLSSPIQMAVVNKVVSDTQINAITTNGAVVPSSDYAIMLSDSLTVDGLAQDVAETLRYYQSQETVIAEAVDFFKDFDFQSLKDLSDQVKDDAQASATNAAAAEASKNAAASSQAAAALSQAAAAASQSEAEATRDEIQHIIDDAGDQSTLVALAQPDGFKKIGQVQSFSALRTITPSYAGQRIKLASYYNGGNEGALEYVAVSGSATDDGGHICVPASGGSLYWQAISETVNLVNYGVRTVLRADLTAGNSEVDYSQNVQNAINRAVATKKPLVSPFSVDPSSPGIYIKKGIAFDGVKTIHGGFMFFLRASEFTGITPQALGTPWAVTNINAELDSNGKLYYGKTNGRQSIDSIFVYNVEDYNPTYPLNGQLHVFNGSHIKGVLRSVNLYGKGVWLASCYDNIFNDIRVETCGNIDAFAFDMIGYPYSDRIDETNSNTINGLMIHDCYDRHARLVGSKNFISRIHQENCFVTTNNPANKLTMDIYCPYGYVNSYIGDGVSMGNYAYWRRGANAYPEVTYFLTTGESIGNLNGVNIAMRLTSDAFLNGSSWPRISCMELNIGADSYGHIGFLRIESSKWGAGNLIVNSDHITIGKAHIQGAANLNAKCVINNLDAASLTVSANAKLGNVKLSGNYSNTANANIDDLTCADFSSSGGVIGNLNCSGNFTMSGGLIANLNTSLAVSIAGGKTLKSTLSGTSTIDLSGGIHENMTISQASTKKISGGTYRNLSCVNGNAVSISGSPEFIGGSFTGPVTLSNNSAISKPALFDNTYTFGSMTFGNYANAVMRDVRHQSQVNLSGANLNVRYAGGSATSLVFGGAGRFTFSPGFACQSVSEWALPSSPSIGDQTVNPSTGAIYAYTSSGWKQVTVS